MRRANIPPISSICAHFESAPPPPQSILRAGHFCAWSAISAGCKNFVCVVCCRVLSLCGGGGVNTRKTKIEKLWIMFCSELGLNHMVQVCLLPKIHICAPTTAEKMHCFQRPLTPVNSNSFSFEVT